MKNSLISLLLVCLSSIGMAQQQSSYPSNYKLREDRKVGAGLSVGGALGVLGGLIELNIEDDDGVLAGFGTGAGYQTLALSWKHAFEGEYFTPYTTLGLASWWNSGNQADASNSSLLKNFLNDKEKLSRKFSLEILSGSAGMQFNQLSGDFVGASFFIEFGALLVMDRTKIMPTGSIGTLYYF